MKNSMENSVQFVKFPNSTDLNPIDSTEISSCQGASAVSQDINVLALVKGKERYIFLYNESNQDKTLRMIGRFASNPELSFTWYDPAVLSQKVRQESQQRAREKQKKQSQVRCDLPLSADNNEF